MNNSGHKAVVFLVVVILCTLLLGITTELG